MFGFVNNALENLVIRTYGEEKWTSVLEKAGVDLDDGHFLHSFQYDDSDTFVLVQCACEVLGLSADKLMELFGEQFALWCKESGYDKVLQRLGRSLGEFLSNLDALHDHLQSTYPGMQAPSFRIEPHPSRKDGIYLHYYSCRVGLEHIVRGIVKKVATEFHSTEVDVEILECNKIEDRIHGYHACFAITPAEGSVRSLWATGELMVNSQHNMTDRVSQGEGTLVNQSIFRQTFPFHFIFDRNMTIRQIGSSLQQVLSETDGLLTVPSLFHLERPCMDLTFDNVLRHINTIYIVRLRQISHECSPVKFRGQMIFIKEHDTIMFVCSPRVTRLHELEEQGLFLSDIAIHDSTRDIILQSESKYAHFQIIQQLDSLTDQLISHKHALMIEKEKSEALLFSILPRQVAEQLINNHQVKSEWFNPVTILFSDIKDFTTICGSCSPKQVVAMLNDLYTRFDELTTRNNVYKVETIGDAYMVVGGLPEPCEDHASNIANLALDMMATMKYVHRPDNNEPITIRIGVHSGEVMAGVVGTKTPRYCLFGDTVNIASRTESNGVPGKIHLSNDTYEYLDKSIYEFEERGLVKFKGREDMMHCWFLERHRFREPCELPFIKVDMELMNILKSLETTPLSTCDDIALVRRESFILDGDMPIRVGRRGSHVFGADQLRRGSYPDVENLRRVPVGNVQLSPPGSSLSRDHTSQVNRNLIEESPPARKSRQRRLSSTQSQNLVAGLGGFNPYNETIAMQHLPASEDTPDLPDGPQTGRSINDIMRKVSSHIEQSPEASVHGGLAQRATSLGEMECPFSSVRPVRKRAVTNRMRSVSSSLCSLAESEGRLRRASSGLVDEQVHRGGTSSDKRRCVSDPTPPSAQWQREHDRAFLLLPGSSASSLDRFEERNSITSSKHASLSMADAKDPAKTPSSSSWLKWYAGASTIACACLIAMEISRYTR